MSIADDLEKLQGLRDRGVLSAEEFERAKGRVLGESASTVGGGPWPDAEAPPPGGTSPGGSPPGTPQWPHADDHSFLRRLARSRSDRFIGGVCGGLGRHTDLPAWVWRVIFVLVTLYFGAGALFYVLLWIFLPLES